MASCGMIIGGLLSYSFIFQFNPIWWLCGFILLAGMLGSARIIVRQHTLNEVGGGFFSRFVLWYHWNFVYLKHNYINL